MNIRRFEKSDAAEVSRLIRTTIQISNAKDYPAELLEALVVWHVRQESVHAVMETEVFCRKKDPLIQKKTAHALNTSGNLFT